jgi:hypothetical protein
MPITPFQSFVPDWVNRGISGLFGGNTAPQSDESRAAYELRTALFGTRSPLTDVKQSIGAVGDDVRKGLSYYSAPATGALLPPKPPPAFGGQPGNSYKDAGWSNLEQKAAEKLGMPQLAPMLFAIRTAGEKSNNDQVSSAGARSVYQIIPSTRDLFKKKYGVDAYASPENAAMVAALHLKESMDRGGDPVREYHGGTNKANWGPVNQAYGQRVNGALGLARDLGAGAPPVFDPSGFDRAGALLGQVQADSMRPFGATYERTELPPPPAPELAVGANYAEGDAAFNAAQPKSPFGSTPEEEEAGKLRIRRGDYFAGMAKALASIDWSSGPGLGELFAKMGAGAVMGANIGDERVRDMVKEHDAAMQRFNLALANREDGQAQEAAQVLNQNTQAMNAHRNNLWQFNVKEIERDNPQMVNGVLVTKQKNPDGTVSETHTPLDPTRRAASLTAQANLELGRANAQNESLWQTFRFNTEMFRTLLPYHAAEAQAAGDYQTRDGIYALGLAGSANAVVEAGQWEALYGKYIGPDRAMQVREEAERVAGVTKGVAPSEAQMEAMNNYVSSQLVTDFVNSGKPYALIGGMATDKAAGGTFAGRKEADPIVGSSIITQQERERKVTRTTNARGQVTTSERY